MKFRHASSSSVVGGETEHDGGGGAENDCQERGSLRNPSPACQGRRRVGPLASTLLWYIIGALQGFLAEHFTLIRMPVRIENMNLPNFPPFSFAAKLY